MAVEQLGTGMLLPMCLGEGCGYVLDAAILEQPVSANVACRMFSGKCGYMLPGTHSEGCASQSFRRSMARLKQHWEFITLQLVRAPQCLWKATELAA